MPEAQPRVPIVPPSAALQTVPAAASAGAGGYYAADSRYSGTAGARTTSRWTTEPQSSRARAGAGGATRKAWVVASSCLIIAFTVFVLLDAFVIERVGQTMQAADLSSIVAAQQGGGTAAGGSDTGQGSGGTGNTGGSDDGAAGAAATGEDQDDSDSARDSEGGSGHSHGPGGHGPSGHGPGGKHGSSDGSGTSGGSGSSMVPGAKSGNSADGSVLEEGAASASTAGTTVGTYSDDNMSITVSQVRAYDTDIYVADIQVSSAEYLKTALAQNAYGRNLKDSTSDMAEEAGAVLAINGDYYGFRDEGYVVRNGVLYRDTAAAGTDALVVYGDGSMASVSQDTTTAQQLIAQGAWQVFSFGPTLVDNGQLAVSAGDEVDQSMGSNPRTAIGMVDPLHYIVVVSGGRTSDNDGLSLYQLAQVMLDNGAEYAYNLDGGGSTTLYYQGEVLNDPSSGNRSGEREVSDIVYFG